MATITTEGRRVYIQTSYGEACVPAIKRLGAHWDAASRRWWIGSGKKAEVEAAVQAAAGKQSTATDDREVTVVGKARYKGRSYYVRWYGRCKSGERKARLTTIDGKLDFWVHLDPTPGHEVASIEKTYDKPRSLAGIREYIEGIRKEEAQGIHRGEAPDVDCYWNGHDWLSKGCSQCRLEGQMCQSCRHDVYDC